MIKPYGILLLSLLSWVVHAQPVGQVSLMLGDAQVMREGAVLKLQKGDAVLVGDRLLTQENGLLQLTMHDGALFSLRANTRIELACYEPACMKVNLLQGEMRQITGEQAKANKERFRLNTPVAAIGVRGTDFITKTTLQDTYVRVLEGAVVAAPFEASCTATGLGVCTTDKAVLLSAADRFILHIQPQGAPVVMPGDGGLQASAQPHESVPPSVAGVQAKLAADNVIYLLKDHPEMLKAMQVSWNGYSPSVVPTDTPALQYSTWNTSENGMATSYPKASVGKEPVVANAQYVLWRDEQRQYMPAQGIIEYGLSASQASIINVQTNATQMAQISQGNLAINFDNRQFTTSLQVKPAMGEALNIQAVGLLTRNDGLFSANTFGGGNLSGALSTDNKQAAYTLTQPLNWQVLQAITQWQAR
jgi:hypothetical protein